MVLAQLEACHHQNTLNPALSTTGIEALYAGADVQLVFNEINDAQSKALTDLFGKLMGPHKGR